MVALSLRAWEPIFTSMRALLGDEIDRLLHTEDWRSYQQRSVEGALDDEDMHVWVAGQDGAVVAFMAVKLDVEPGLGELYMIAVDPDSQNRGVGTRMTNFATDWMRAEGMRLALIGTGGDPGHAAARRTYDKSGYTPMPVANYYKAL